MGAMASQITNLSIICWNVCSGADQRKHQSSASLAFVRGIHRWPVNFPHKGPVTRKMFPFDDVIMPRKLIASIMKAFVANLKSNYAHVSHIDVVRTGHFEQANLAILSESMMFYYQINPREQTPGELKVVHSLCDKLFHDGFVRHIMSVCTFAYKRIMEMSISSKWSIDTNFIRNLSDRVHETQLYIYCKNHHRHWCFSLSVINAILSI